MTSLRSILPDFIGKFSTGSRRPVELWSMWACLLTLASFWPIPNGFLPFHRNFLIFIILILTAANCFKTTGLCGDILRPIKGVIWPLFLLSIWLLVSGLFFSGKGLIYAELYNGKWLRALETGWIGLAILPILIPAQSTLRPVDILWGLLCFMWLVVFVQFADTFINAIQIHGIPWQFTRIAYSRMELSVHVNMVLSFLAAEMALRIALGRRWLPVSMPVLAIMLLICFLTGLQLATRNATVGMVGTILSIMVLVLVFRFKDWSLLKIIGSCVIGVTILIGVLTISFDSDSRWKSLLATVPYSLDTQHNKFWLNNTTYPLPKLKDGSGVDVSNYERLAWFKVGWGIVAKEPLGIGIASDNFHRLVEKYYQEPSTTSQSHSGLLNFTLAAGIPGLILWLCIIGYLLKRGWVCFYRHKKTAGLFLIMFVFGFAVRSIFDDVLRDHMLEIFFFFSALLLALCEREVSSDSGEEHVKRCGETM